MARSTTPAIHIGELLHTEAIADRGIITFDSAGAEVRLSLSRHQIGKLAAFARALAEMMDERPGCEVIPLRKVKRRAAKAPTA